MYDEALFPVGRHLVEAQPVGRDGQPLLHAQKQLQRRGYLSRVLMLSQVTKRTKVTERMEGEHGPEQTPEFHLADL